MNALRTFKLSVVVFICYIAQTTFMHSLKIHNAIPNLLVVLVICFSLMELNELVSAVFGLVCGILLDVSGGRVFGVNSLLCMSLAYVCTMVSEKLFKGKFWVSILFVFITSMVYEFLYYLLCFGIWIDAHIFHPALFSIIPTTLYNVCVAVLLFFLIKRLEPSKQ